MVRQKAPVAKPTQYKRIQPKPISRPAVAGKASFQTSVYLPDSLVHISGSGPVRVLVTTQKVTSRPGAQ